MAKGAKPAFEVKISCNNDGKTYYRKVGVAWKNEKGSISVQYDEPGDYKSVVLIPIK